MDHLIEDFAINPSLRANLVVSVENARASPANHVDFFSFPETLGWYITEDHLPRTMPRITPAPAKLAHFLQQWLFFGLIRTVVQGNGQPLVSIEHLIQGGQVHTGYLGKHLRDWVTWERDHPDGSSFRMLRADMVLEQARRVVKAMCGVNHDATSLVMYSHEVGHHNHMTNELALSLMTVGEILSAVKHQIVENNRAAHFSGWHGDDDSGWGPPLYVFNKMEENQWCKRTVHLLKGQLRANATLLLAAWTSWNECMIKIARDHEKCTSEKCTYFPGSGGNGDSYTPQHYKECPGSNSSKLKCPMEGPDVDTVCQILNKGGIPLIRMDFHENKFQKLSVVQWHDGIDFTCISHVWSHGYGNEKENKVAKCQLEFIHRQVQKFRGVFDMPEIHIWMDTLVIPVGAPYKQQRKIAMMQIERVFEAAQSTLVLDRHLISMGRGADSKPAQAAMRILASGWMRRLWTLQEAFLSRRLMIPFKEGEMSAQDGTELDSLADQFHFSIQQAGISSALLTTVKNQLLHNLMGHDRFSRNQSRMDHVNPRQPQKHGISGALLISNVWRAARFRDVGKPEIEARALATLLGLNYSGTDIEKAGIDINKDDPLMLDKLMMAFWTQVDEQLRAIPPGIVFLPGKKIHVQGFGWAPSTWLSADEVDYPDPLRVVHSTTKLHARYGLLVQYPGFRLHSKERSHILKIVTSRNDPKYRGICFPVDRHLQEWYRVTSADDTPSDFIEKIKSETTQLAIILCRARPKDSIPEIGLLVETWQVLPDPTHDEMRTIYCTYVIHRVWVSRYSRARYNTEEENVGDSTSQGTGSGSRMAEFFSRMETECIGEVISPDQSWYVDRRQFHGQHPLDKKVNETASKRESKSLTNAARTFSFFLR